MSRIILFAFLISLGFLFFIASSVAGPVNPLPQADPSFKTKDDARVGIGCSYTVKIKTSCSSPRYTRDYISIAFGDVYRNEVYVPRLDDPSTGTFERCSTDTFRVQGPCGYGVCYLYLRRAGWDGWVPESVYIYEDNYRRAVTFYYGTTLPDTVWYGFNNCGRVQIATTSNVTESLSGGDLISQL